MSATRAGRSDDIYTLIAQEQRYVDVYSVPLSAAERVHIFCDEETARAWAVTLAEARLPSRSNTRAIAARYLDYQAKRRATRMQRECEEVRQVIYKLHAQGDYPSAWRVAKLLKARGLFRDPEVLRTWRATLLELGLR